MCDCIEAMNRELASRNAEISLPIIGPTKPFITLNKLDATRRTSLPLLFASHCPFCGEKYPPTEPTASDKQAPMAVLKAGVAA